MTPIPQHLTGHDWYAPHLAWLASIDVTPRHDPGDAKPKLANLTGADLSGADLRSADLRWAHLTDTIFRGANLADARLRDADLRRAILTGANLSDAILRGADLTGAALTGASLSEPDLRGANLTGANLTGVDLTDANLTGANLSGAIGLPDAPVVPDIDAAILTAIEQDGCALDMDEWHTCGTTHCRAGWATTLAGEAGAELEERYGPGVAGALIYAASCPDQPVPDWYTSNEEAIADMRQRAGVAR